MSESSLLTSEGIDALLGRFRERQEKQETLQASTAHWAVDEPNVLAADAMAAMKIRHGAISTRMSAEVSAVVRTHVEASLGALKQQRLRTVVDTLGERACVVRFDIAELTLPAFLILEPSTAMSIIDLLIGGHGEFAEIGRDFTRIEQRVLADVFSPAVDAHRSGYSGISSLSATMGSFYGSAQAMRAFPSTDLYLVADYTIRVDRKLDWPMRLALPLAQIREAIEATARIPVQTAELGMDRRKDIERKLVEVAIGTEVVLGKSELTLHDVTELAPGDVVVLDRKTTQSFDMLVEGVPKYRGTLGRSGRSLAFRVSDVVERTEESR